MKAFILAGGFATRLWPLTEHRAKPLLPLAGRPIISHLLEKIPKDIPVTVSTNAAFEEQFRAWATETSREKLEIVVEHTTNEDEKLGALGALAQWITDAAITDDVLVLAGDNVLGFSIADFLAAAEPGTPLLAAHDIGDRERAKVFGTVVIGPKPLRTAIHRVHSFEEKSSEPKSTLVSTGCVLLPAATLPILVAFAQHSPDNLGSIFEELLRGGATVECFTFAEPWLDIGSFGSYLAAHRLLVRGTLRDTTAALRESTTTGSVSIGASSVVECSSLTDCIVFRSCTIRDCVLRDCVIDDGCVLEGIDLVGKMVRAGTVLRK